MKHRQDKPNSLDKMYRWKQWEAYTKAGILAAQMHPFMDKKKVYPYGLGEDWNL